MRPILTQSSRGPAHPELTFDHAAREDHHMTILKPLGAAGALIAAALVGGTLIGSTLAVDEETDTDASDSTVYCETFRDTFASELGVSVDGLTEAGKAAANATIDAAVAAGDLDEDRAAALRERIAAHDGTCDGLGPFSRGLGHGFGMGFEQGLERGLGNGPMGGGGMRIGGLEAAADALGVDTVDLRAQLAAGASLQEISGDTWEDVKAAVLADVQERLDEAVAEGLDQERADTILEHITTWLDGGGQLDEMGGPAGGMGPGQGRGHGPGGRGGQGGGMGPGFFGDTDDGE
jgi:hypothetical protein